MSKFIRVDPRTRHVDGPLSERRLVKDHFQSLLVGMAAEIQTISILDSKSDRTGKEVDGPLVNADEEGPSIQAILVSVDDEVDVLERGQALWGQENVQWDLRVDDDRIGIIPPEEEKSEPSGETHQRFFGFPNIHEPCYAIFRRQRQLLRDQGKDVQRFIPIPAHALVA